MRLPLILCGLLLFALPAEARMHVPYRGHRIVASGAPLDSFAAPAAAYSMRRLKSSYTGPAIRLRRASDNAETDIPFLGFTGFTGAPIDTAAAATFCAATSCFLTTWYDQSGNGQNATRPTTTLQPAYIANCAGTLPCARTGGSIDGAGLLTAGAAASATDTYSAVMRRQAGTSYCFSVYGPGSNHLVIDFGNLRWYMSSGAGGGIYDTSAAATVTPWRAGIGVFAGAASVLRLDATELTGTATGVVGSGAGQIGNGDAIGACDYAEIVRWVGYAMPVGERATLTANQKSFWGF